MPSAPKAPDPAVTAAAQAGANKQAVYDSANVNQINEVGPYGSRTYTGEVGSPDRTVTTALSPDEQKKYDLLNSAIFGMGSHVQNRLGQITDAPFSLDGAPERVFGGAQTKLQSTAGPGSDVRAGINQRYQASRAASAALDDSQFVGTGQFKAFQDELNDYYGSITDQKEIEKELAHQQARINDPTFGASAQQFVNTLQGRQAETKDKFYGDVAPIQTALDMSGVSGIAGLDDFGAERQRVEDALYSRQTARLDPQFQQQRTALETRLANQGITMTSNPAAYQQAMDNFERNKNDAYSAARNDSIGAAGGEQGRLFGQSMTARGQTFGEAATKGGFVNQAQGQAYDQTLNSANFGNTWNRINQQDQNAARDSFINELLLTRSQPLNELNALLSGTQVNTPQFGNIAQYQMAAPDIGGYIQNNYNQQMSGRNALLGALGGLAGAGGQAAMMKWG